MRFRVPFILASRSPRRRHLLDLLGFDFTVIASDVPEEVDPSHSPEQIVRSLAKAKAQAVAASHPDALVLGADTIVVLDGTILGKPRDRDDAQAMLRALSGRTHTVYSGIGLICDGSGRSATAAEATDVTFAELSDDEIDAYVATGSPMDKAGAYGIQDDRGALYIERIEGDYYNVVGLPLHRLYRTLQTEFSDLIIEPAHLADSSRPR